MVAMVRTTAAFGCTADIATAAGDAPAKVLNIDKNDKVTFNNGEIQNIDMPPMSMFFNVEDKAMQDKVQVGEKI